MNARDAARKSLLEALETRLLLAVTLDGTGNLLVNGTAGDDVVKVQRDLRRTSKYLLTLNGAGSKFSAAAVNTITVLLGDGDDRVDFQEQPGPINARMVARGGAGKDYIAAFPPFGRVPVSTADFDGEDDDDLIAAAGAIAATLTGGAGNDSIYGSIGPDLIDCGLGNDQCAGDRGNNTILGGDGNDLLEGGKGLDAIVGGEGDDTLSGRYSNDYLDGGNGNDWILGGQQDDVLIGGAGDDRLEGEAGNDHIFGDAGNDILVGDDGNDTLCGDDEEVLSFIGDPARVDAIGNDLMDAGAGDDVLLGGPDTPTDRNGLDTMIGGAGNDVLDTRGDVYTERQPGDTIPTELHHKPPAPDTLHMFDFAFAIKGCNGAHTGIVPAGIGAYANSVFSTTDASGTVHVVYTSFGTQILYLRQFLSIWGITLDASHFGRFVKGVNASTGPVMTVNRRANLQYGDYALKAGDSIVIDLGAAPCG
jgi:Ca2+-binding RTX toxin-like protein